MPQRERCPTNCPGTVSSFTGTYRSRNAMLKHPKCIRGTSNQSEPANKNRYKQHSCNWEGKTTETLLTIDSTSHKLRCGARAYVPGTATYCHLHWKGNKQVLQTKPRWLPCCEGIVGAKSHQVTHWYPWQLSLHYFLTSVGKYTVWSPTLQHVNNY